MPLYVAVDWSQIESNVKWARMRHICHIVCIIFNYKVTYCPPRSLCTLSAREHLVDCFVGCYRSIIPIFHDDVIKWTHLRYWPFVRGIRRSPVDSVNIRDAGDLRRYWAHYDVSEMHYGFKTTSLNLGNYQAMCIVAALCYLFRFFKNEIE